MFLAGSAFANGNHDSNSHHDYGCGECAGTNGVNGTNGTNGTNGLNGRDGSDGSFNSATYSYGIASASAIANIPALSHTTSGHSHTGIGVGFGTFDNADVLAIGIMHQVDNLNFKATVSDSLDMFGNADGTHSVFGLGASVNF